MKLIHAARLSAAFLVIALTVSVTVAILSGGGVSSRSYKADNKDPRTVLVQLALVSASPNGSSKPAIDLLRDRFAPSPDGAKPIDHAAFASTLSEARGLLAPTDLWLSPALAAQHAEEASLAISVPGKHAGSVEFAVAPFVLEKDVLRTGISLSLSAAPETAALDWSTTLTLRDGAVIAVDMSSIDQSTGKPNDMLMIVRASIVTKKPG